MIIWTGWGFIVPLIALFNFVLFEYLSEIIYKDSSYYQMHLWPKIAASVCSSILIWIINKYFLYKKIQHLIDPKSGEEVILKRTHSLFFIELSYWAIILPIATLIISLIN